MPDHRFINIQAPDDARSRRTLWNVRSQASRSSRSPARASRQRSTRRRQEAEAAAEGSERLSREATASSQGQQEETDATATEPDLTRSVSNTPYGSYPVPPRPYFPAALNYRTGQVRPKKRNLTDQLL